MFDNLTLLLKSFPRGLHLCPAVWLSLIKLVCHQCELDLEKADRLVNDTKAPAKNTCLDEQVCVCVCMCVCVCVCVNMNSTNH